MIVSCNNKDPFVSVFSDQVFYVVQQLIVSLVIEIGYSLMYASMQTFGETAVKLPGKLGVIAAQDLRKTFGFQDGKALGIEMAAF
ncbi:hypothetical protein KSK37_12830 [Kaistella sp. DKR-2]|uniref:hypothetical protein n=1 Tax=Kaistella soli TaxID=2849654 RepID=UPI001C2560AF|nr:hypothetical protein [Kaistella soli]MBU8883973.1 hypothetical protein [Kaistella soli]